MQFSQLMTTSQAESKTGVRAGDESQTPHPQARASKQHTALGFQRGSRSGCFLSYREELIKPNLQSYYTKQHVQTKEENKNPTMPVLEVISPGLKGQKSVARSQDWGRQFFSVIQKLHPPQPSTHRKHTNQVSEIMPKGPEEFTLIVTALHQEGSSLRGLSWEPRGRSEATPGKQHCQARHGARQEPAW